jgi:hypothetical protein
MQMLRCPTAVLMRKGLHMKRKLLCVILSLLLEGCVVVPAGYHSDGYYSDGYYRGGGYDRGYYGYGHRGYSHDHGQ